MTRPSTSLRAGRGLFALVTASTIVTVVLSTAAVPAGQGQPRAPRTPDGKPDLQGVWNYATVTPLERPKDLGNKELFTPEEAAAYAKQAVERSDVDANRPNQSKTADVGSAYSTSTPAMRGTKGCSGS